MPNISDFVSRMKGGGARPNQFEVFVHFPTITGAIGRKAGEDLVFVCRAASLPAATISDITVGYRGRPVHFAGEREFSPWAISVLNDANFRIRTAFEIWSDAIVRFNSTEGFQTPKTYMAEVIVRQLDRNGNRLKQYTLHDAYPVNIGEIQLSFDQNNQIEEFPVQFVYNWFTPDDVSQ